MLPHSHGLHDTQQNSRSSWLPLLILLLIPIVMRLPALLGILSPDPMFFTAAVGDLGHVHGGYPWIDPNVGFQGQALGKLSADQWLSGHIPWWNTYNGVGLPLAAEAQPGSLFLPFVLLMHFRSGGMWVELLLQLIAGASTYALLRKLELVRAAAFAGALLFELNGTFAWHGAPIVSPIAFLPVLLLGIETLRARVIENAAGGWWLIPLALAWSLYAGFPEVAYINGLLAGAWVLARLSGMGNAHGLLFIRTLCMAVLVGLLLSLPLIAPMIEYIGRAYIGMHDDSFAHVSPPLATLPQYLMPWLYGPISKFNDPSNVVATVWSESGGYLTALPVLLALLGVIFCRRRLYYLLLAWMFLCLTKTFDVRPFSDLVNMIPMIKVAAFYRYAPPSWEFAGAVMTAMCLHGMRHEKVVKPSRIMLVFTLVCTAVAGALWQVNDITHAMVGMHSSYVPYFRIACSWLVLSMFAGVALVLLRNRWNHAMRALVILLSLDACMAFALPARGGVGHLVVYEPGVAFLQHHLGVQRTYTLGPLSPNYGGFFEVAQINHNYLPVPRDWVDYIHTHLDPGADPIIFNGSYGSAGRAENAIRMLNEHLGAYEEVGIKYVIAPAQTDPFAEASQTTSNPGSTEGTALALADQQHTTVSWQLPGSSAGRVVGAITVLIDNYRASSDGLLSVRLCNDQAICSEGSQNLRESSANAPFKIALDQPLHIPSSGQHPPRISLTISHLHSTHPVAIWMVVADPAQQIAVDGKPVVTAPTIALQYQTIAGMDMARLAYDGTDMAIYELPHPKPYFEALDPGCRLQVLNRHELLSYCSAPTRLIRREAFYPGWNATIDDAAQPVQRINEIFQGLNLPAGEHRIAFTYRPSHGLLILAGFLAGALGMALGICRELQRRRWRQAPPNSSSAITIASSRPLRAG